MGPWATANYCRAGIKSLRGTVWFKTAFSKRDKKQTMIGLRGIHPDKLVSKPMMSHNKAFKAAGSGPQPWALQNVLYTTIEEGQDCASITVEEMQWHLCGYTCTFLYSITVFRNRAHNKRQWLTEPSGNVKSSIYTI